jgi:hypothetical protein
MPPGATLWGHIPREISETAPSASSFIISHPLLESGPRSPTRTQGKCDDRPFWTIFSPPRRIRATFDPCGLTRLVERLVGSVRGGPNGIADVNPLSISRTPSPRRGVLGEEGLALLTSTRRTHYSPCRAVCRAPGPAWACFPNHPAPRGPPFPTRTGRTRPYSQQPREIPCSPHHMKSIPLPPISPGFQTNGSGQWFFKLGAKDRPVARHAPATSPTCGAVAREMIT